MPVQELIALLIVVGVGLTALRRWFRRKADKCSDCVVANRCAPSAVSDRDLRVLDVPRHLHALKARSGRESADHR